MKIGKILIAAAAVSVFSAIFGAVTCGGIFSWVYKLEPTNVWKPTYSSLSLVFFMGIFLLNIILALVYALLRKGIPGKNKAAKGFVFGLCVWGVGMLPGMFSTYYFMTVATGVVIYWAILGLVEMPFKGLIIAILCGE
jgi:hypothetical protein